MAPTIINTLKTSSIAVMNFDYTIANPKPSLLPEEVKSYGLKILEWDLQNSNNFIKDISAVDLLVFKSNNFIFNSWALEEQIKSLSDAIKASIALFLYKKTFK
jgi:hypothetical protein